MKLIRRLITLLVVGMVCFAVVGNSASKTKEEKEEQKSIAVDGTVGVIETIIDCVEEYVAD